MTRQRLGTRLAAWTAATTAVALLVFGAIAIGAVWAHEAAERDEATPATDAVVQVAPTLALALPFVLAVAYLTSRRLARRLTDRVDGIIDAARRVSHDDLQARLPVSPAADELDELATSLNAVFVRIDEGLAAQRQFAADASHELRTPLTILQSELEIARRRPRSPDEWEAVADRARDEVVRMTALVEALLRLARTTTAPTTAPIAARVLLDDLAARWTATAAAAEVGLELTAADELTVTGDADALAVAVGNLIANAIAHAPAGTTVRVDVRRVAAQIEIVVADRGPGVAAADRQRIFQPFARGRTAADRRDTDRGVGLGLSVAHRIITVHRGTLRVDDEPGGGARFIATLPA